MLKLPEDLERRKAATDARGGVDAYPFDPSLDKRMVSFAQGLDRLCYVEDRSAAAWLYQMYWQAEAAGRDALLKAERQRELDKKKANELEWMTNVAKSSLAGAFGAFIRQDAERGSMGLDAEDDWQGLLNSDGTMRDDEATLRAWIQRIRKMDWKSGADATKRMAR
jgi:hypothetical protein